MPEELEPFDLLIVDDDESIGAILLAILKKAGYRGKWVATGEAALGAALDYRTGGRALHAALIDLRLPDANGLDVLRGLKKLHPDVGCVIMTGYADTTTAIDALNNGASAYVQKPYNIDEIKAILGRIAERQKLVLENRELVSKLQEANAALETKVSQRTQELRHANFQLLATI
ncbi:MAG: response regulator, partial [Elusimicrobiota bacterium]